LSESRFNKRKMKSEQRSWKRRSKSILNSSSLLSK
jgi:hypothetical protein